MSRHVGPTGRRRYELSYPRMLYHRARCWLCGRRVRGHVRSSVVVVCRRCVRREMREERW